MTRKFEDYEATREQLPLLVGLMGPSNGGKTFSALRLATGIQKVSGGDIYFIDTEARRSLQYADKFNFRHVPFGAPFGPLDYLAAIHHCVDRGAGVVIVDSMSHEHEGPGGVLDTHETEVERLSKAWKTTRDAVQFPAWGKPKGDRRRLINSILQLQTNFIFCFRAKQKVRMPNRDKGEKKPQSIGFMPIAGEEFLYEMTVCGLLPPGSQGIPQWHSEHHDGEGLMIKLPAQFANIVTTGSAVAQLSEDIGEKMAHWAAGGKLNPREVLAAIAAADTAEQLKAIASANKRKPWSGEDRDAIGAAITARKDELKRREISAPPAEAGDAWEA
ncbi:MAG: hypothetical protein R3337_00195 [Gammaproteobacteria bacterium]|nr:hypothetical protein [Gammaproteobacteria bacterium]